MDYGDTRRQANGASTGTGAHAVLLLTSILLALWCTAAWPGNTDATVLAPTMQVWAPGAPRDAAGHLDPFLYNALPEANGSLELASTLTAPPAANVTVTLLPDLQVTTDVQTLTFTPSDWSEPHQFRVTTVNDTVLEPLLSTSFIRYTSLSTDSRFNAMAMPQTLIKINDDDGRFILSEPVGHTVVSESGVSDVYTIVLRFEPTSPVLITIVADRTRLRTDRKRLVFTPDNWDVPQVVRVMAVNDARHNGTRTAMIRHYLGKAPRPGAAPGPHPCTGVPCTAAPTIPSLAVRVFDNDPR